MPDPKDKPQDSDTASRWADDQRDRGYYYDDSHGYETFRPTIWTIGHSTRDLAEFIALVRESDIELLADVRSYPGSRKYPHFGKDSLELSLPQSGIAYIHLKQLGGRRKPKPDSDNTVWRSDAFRGYADHMETGDFRAGVSELIELSDDRRTAIMCSEAIWWRCHRALISDYMKSRGMTVLHIMGEGKVEEHPYTSAARIVDGELSYRPE